MKWIMIDKIKNAKYFNQYLLDGRRDENPEQDTSGWREKMANAVTFKGVKRGQSKVHIFWRHFLGEAPRSLIEPQ